MGAMEVVKISSSSQAFIFIIKRQTYGVFITKKSINLSSLLIIALPSHITPSQLLYTISLPPPDIASLATPRHASPRHALPRTHHLARQHQSKISLAHFSKPQTCANTKESPTPAPTPNSASGNTATSPATTQTTNASVPGPSSAKSISPRRTAQTVWAREIRVW